ncbi:glucose dehydrogenase [FAD, quinone]-like [Anticarsia gemmatalis]|uniref:glucose dehydrogenase [FAD, quinone]-like n=1 Tax=Anticarsia gemmatalis TaxID=129554 RepID=UPI003F75D40A
MSTQATTLRGLMSNTRIMFGLLPGLGAMIVLRMAIHLYRPDIEDADNRVRDHPFEQLYNCYDFIIVGGGSAGSVLANRLSENPNWKVLLLEAGQDENVLSEVPVLFPVLQTSSIDWQFLTESSDEYCLSMVDRKCKWPRGKVLGGSSVLNAMLYIRGNKRDYDNWESMGNVGWGYNEVLKYFLKSEDIRIPGYEDNPYHATGGPLTVEYFAYEQPITRKILEAGEQLGYQIRDVNGEFQTGFTRSQATVRDGLRCSTAKGYLRPAAKRDNLHVSVHSIVHKVLIDENKVAYGVKFAKHGQEKIIKASKEVILSAGALQSPQLLILSGIGDAEHLKELGIYPIVNLPGVGKNLQDHVAMGGHSFLFDNPYDNGTDYCFNLNTVMSIGSVVDFSINKKGPMYSMMEAEAMAFVKTKYENSEDDYPDIQLFIAPTADNMDGGLFGKRANGLTNEAYAELYEEILYESSFSVVPLLLRPRSRGYLKLRDTNPYSPPLIYPNYYSDPQDVRVMIEGARIVQKLVEQPALKALNARPNPHRNPGCAAHELMSDEHLECQARHHTLTIYHPVGTCAMGPDPDSGAVVDPRLKVYGVKSLRVIDGSIMPNIVSGNTNAPIIMIAEKASDMIKEDWADVVSEQTCPEQSQIAYQSKSSEGEEPTKVEMTRGPPNLFNETTSLFPHLSEPVSEKVTKFAGDNKPAASNDYKQTEPQAKYPNNNVKEPSTYSIKQPNQYSVKRYPYFVSQNPFRQYLYNPQSIHNRVQDLGQNFFKRPGNLFSYLASRKSRVYPKPRPVKKPLFSNTLGSYYDTNRARDPTYYYETTEEMTPKGQKKCKLWLYHDGVKYEVIL